MANDSPPEKDMVKAGTLAGPSTISAIEQEMVKQPSESKSQELLSNSSTGERSISHPEISAEYEGRFSAESKENAIVRTETSNMLPIAQNGLNLAEENPSTRLTQVESFDGASSDQRPFDDQVNTKVGGASSDATKASQEFEMPATPSPSYHSRYTRNHSQADHRTRRAHSLGRIETRTIEHLEGSRVVREIEYYDRPEPPPQPVTIHQRAPKPQRIIAEEALSDSSSPALDRTGRTPSRNQHRSDRSTGASRVRFTSSQTAPISSDSSDTYSDVYGDSSEASASERWIGPRRRRRVSREFWERPSRPYNYSARRNQPPVPGEASSGFTDPNAPPRILALESATPYADSFSNLKSKIQAAGGVFERLPSARTHSHATRTATTSDAEKQTITVYLGGSRYHPEPKSEAQEALYQEPFFASRRFGPPNMDRAQRFGLKAIAKDIETFLRVVGKEFGGFPGSTLGDPVDPQGSPLHVKMKGGAACIMIIEGSPWWLRNILQEVFPRFPRDLIHDETQLESSESTVLIPTFRSDEDRPLEKLINRGVSERHSHSKPKGQFIRTQQSGFSFRTESLDVIAERQRTNHSCECEIIHKIGNAEIHRSPLSVWYETPQKHRFFSQPLLAVLAKPSLRVPERLSSLYWNNSAAGSHG